MTDQAVKPVAGDHFDIRDAAMRDTRHESAMHRCE
jgi:hypothetical protein